MIWSSGLPWNMQMLMHFQGYQYQANHTLGCVREATLFNLFQIGSLPPSPKQLEVATSKDPILAWVSIYISKGWPVAVEPPLQPFFNRKWELSSEAGCLSWGSRVISPKKYHRWVSDKLKRGHQGIVKMKVWWPNIDKDLEELSIVSEYS